jgi:hypothetical protein
MAALTILFFAITPAAHACRCAQPTLEEGLAEFNNMDYVFEGEVISTSPAAMGRKPMVKFKILNRIKGVFPNDSEDEKNLFYNPVTAACGNSFHVGQHVIIGAYDEGKWQARVVDFCAQENIRFYLGNQNKKPMSVFKD